MNPDREEINKLFEEVQEKTSENLREMMEQLWLKWSHLGVDVETKVSNIKQLVQIEKELHRDVIVETEEKLNKLRKEIGTLKEELDELKKNLPSDIEILDLNEDVLIIYKEELEKQIAEYKQQMAQRRVLMDRFLEWQKILAENLGVTIDELQDVRLPPLPTLEELKRFENYLEVLQSERNKRCTQFLDKQVEIKKLLGKLQIKPQNKFENMVVTLASTDFKVTDLNMDRLAKFHQDLQEKYQQTNNRVLELRERLTKLWDCLEEDHIYRENFLQAHPGCHSHTENAIKEEIKRCEQIKRQKIQVFVANIRTKIKLMWDNIMYSTQEREEFIHYYQDIFTEDTLTLHELYLDKITKFYNDHKNIFDMLATRKNLWLKMTELEARATEPGRYHNRGGQLLKEEKERKAIASNLPKIEAQIKDLVMEYETNTGNTFTVDGKPLLQFIEDEWEIRKAERHNKLSARKQAQTPTTPLLRSMATSPLGKRNRTAAGLAATAEKNRLPAKRQLITSSATKAMSSVSTNLSAFRRTAISTVKRRMSGRLAARAVAEGNGESVKRKLDYGNELKVTPKLTINGSILKHKRRSCGRRSTGRRSISKTHSANDTQDDENVSEQKVSAQKDPLMETTMLTTYTDFKDGINEKQISRSSMATKAQEVNIPSIVMCEPIMERNCNGVTPIKTPRNKMSATPSKFGKENIHLSHYSSKMTPQKSVLCTPNKLTRSALKLNNEGFATPRTPLSANKVNLQRQNTASSSMSLKTTPNNVSRSKTSSNLVRAKNLPPLI